MATHNSLILGPRAHGTIGKTHTFANVKGVAYMKAKSTPKYTDTIDQHTQRANWKALVDKWHSGDYSGADKLAFNNAAGKRASGLSGWNYFMKYYRLAFSSGLVITFVKEVTATVGAPNLTVAGKCSANIDLLINVYNSTGTFAYSTTTTVAVGVFSEVISLANIPPKGYVELITSDPLNQGRTGWYPYAV